MKDSIEERLSEIKGATIDSEETKKYIIKIKSMIDNYYKQYDGEISKEELWESFVEEYYDELKFRGESAEIYNEVLQHVAMDKFISSIKGDRYTYNYVMKRARTLESLDSKEALFPSMDIKETIVALLRSAMRYNPGMTEKGIVQTAPEQKEKIDKNLRGKLIKNIQFYVTYLNQYGFLDDFIASSNDILDELKLDKIKFEKRNPLPDVQYDKEGNIVKDVEDIGVIDAFSEEALEKISIEDLVLMNMAWESQYLQARIEMERAIVTIDSLDLYEKVINREIKDIEDLPEEDIEKALKRDLALTYIFKAKQDLKVRLAEEKRKNSEYDKEKVEEEALDEIVTPKVKKHYKKMLKENGFDDKEILVETLRDMNPEYENLYATGEDITILQGVLIYLIEQKALKIKKWGTIDAGKIFEGLEENPELLYVAIENAGFRGPIVMEMPKEVAESIIRNCNGKEIPEYKGYIDEKYCEIMARLLVPATQYFKNTVKQRYKEDPTSRLNAALAGKSVKNEGR